MIEEIKQRLEKITPGVWWQGGKIPGWGSIFSVLVETDTGYKSVASTGGHSDNKADPEQLRDWQVADADFIAHAPSDMRALLAEIERLEARLNDIADYFSGDGWAMYEKAQADNAQLRAALERAQYRRSTGFSTLAYCIGCSQPTGWVCLPDCYIANALKGKD